VNLKELDLLELVLAEDTAGVLSSGSGFGAEASRPRGHVNGKFFFGDGFVPMQVVEFDFGSGVSQKSVFSSLKRSAAKFRQLARAGE